MQAARVDERHAGHVEEDGRVLFTRRVDLALECGDGAEIDLASGADEARVLQLLDGDTQ